MNFFVEVDLATSNNALRFRTYSDLDLRLVIQPFHH